MIGGGSDKEFVLKISKTFIKFGKEKGINYVHILDWIYPKREKQKLTLG